MNKFRQKEAVDLICDMLQAEYEHKIDGIDPNSPEWNSIVEQYINMVRGIVAAHRHWEVLHGQC